MGRKTSAGGRRAVSARTASPFDNIEDITERVLRDTFGIAQSGELWRRQGVRITGTRGGDTVFIETSGANETAAIDKMRDIEQRLRNAAPNTRRIERTSDREKRGEPGNNPFRWQSAFRMTARPRIPDLE